MFGNDFEDGLEFLGNKLFFSISNNKDIDLQLMSDYISCTNSSFSIFNATGSTKGKCIKEINYIGIKEIIRSSLNRPDISNVFEFLFLGNQIDWSQRSKDYYEFEEIVEEFVSYVKNNLELNIDDFIHEFRGNLSNFLESYIKSVQNEIDEEYHYDIIMDDTIDDFLSCLNFDKREFFKNKFKKEVSPKIENVVKKNLLKKPLGNYLLGIDFDYSGVVDMLLFRYEEERFFEINESPNCKFKIVDD